MRIILTGAIGSTMKNISDLDDIDRRLIEFVRRDNLTPARVLADHLGLSISAVLRRLRRLREEKIIIADIAVIDPALTGAALTMHVTVRLKAYGRQEADAFARRIAGHPQVVSGWEVIGEDHFMLKVQVATMQEYDAFIRDALDSDDSVEAYKTAVSVRSILVGPGAPSVLANAHS